jgi:2-deoxystreptamine N-acetyl-D-glucosaminyltransferase/2-deoxystreptamine glucosyltransferase
MVLGLLPAIRGGLGDLARTGQHARLLRGYLAPYARAFDEVRYFSYLDETLARYTEDPALLARVRVVPGGHRHPWLQTALMPFGRAAALRGCSVLRVFQLTGALPAVAARHRWGVPFATTYGFWYARLARSRGRRLLHAALERLALGAADAVIVTTPELAAHVGRRVAADRIHLIPNGVDTALFAPAAARPAGRRVVYVGRLSAEKDLGTLVEAAAKLARLDVRLLFVGAGPERAALEAAAGARRVPLEIAPVVPNDRLPAVLAGAAAFALPSLTEGHPKALLEAMSTAVPCVASDVGGNRALLRDGETGLLVPPGDPAALAGALERVLTDEALAGALARRAREHVVGAYDLGALVAREIALLQRLAGRR